MSARVSSYGEATATRTMRSRVLARQTQVGELEASPTEVLRSAETLGIPWQRILRGEIEAEQRLRRYFTGIAHEFCLAPAVRVLSLSLFDSWRARDEVTRLACEARGVSRRDAKRQLWLIFRELTTGKGGNDNAVFAEHFWRAYQRVLLLQRVRRAAAKSRGPIPERLAFICSTARCRYDDAAWAVAQEDSARRGNRFEAAVRKVRGEGYLIPRAKTETRSLAELRRILRKSPHSPKRRHWRVRSQDWVSTPQRVQLPVNTI